MTKLDSTLKSRDITLPTEVGKLQTARGRLRRVEGGRGSKAWKKQVFLAKVEAQTPRRAAPL